MKSKHKPKILVVGSFVMDMITKTEVFPKLGQTVLGYHHSKATGGKGSNQALQSALLGAEVMMVGKVGQDSIGNTLIATLQRAGIDVTQVGRSVNNISSGIGNVIVTTKDGIAQNNRIIVIPGANMTITPDDVNFLKNDIAKFDMVILQFEIPMLINEIVAKYAFDKGVPVMINPAPFMKIPEDLLAHSAIVSPNETEAAKLLNCEIQREGRNISENTLVEIKKKAKEMGINKLLITLGDAGAVMIKDNEVISKNAVADIQVSDPTAAGDSFVSAFCTAVCAGMSDEDALEFANLIAARTVSFLGAQPSLPTLEQGIEFHKCFGRNTDLLLKFKEMVQ